MIKSVELKNWRSHGCTKMEFDSGVNLLVGRMGSGKSSVMDAICFCLFGTFPALQQRKLQLDDIIQTRPKEKDDAEVIVTLLIDNENYEIKRVIQRGKGTTTSEIRKNGSLLEAPQSSKVTEVVQNLLKIDYDLFYRAIYSEQNNIDYFLTLAKGQRMKKIDELLKIDRFEKVRTNETTLINQIKVRRKEKLLDIKRMEEQFDEEKFLQTKNEINELKKDLELSKEKIMALEQKTEQATKELNYLEEKRNMLEEKTRKFIQAKTSVHELEEMIVEADIKKLEKQRDDIEEQLNKITEKLDDIKAEYASFQKQLNDIEIERASKKAKLEQLKNNYEQAEKISAEIKKLKNLIASRTPESFAEKLNSLSQILHSKQALLEQTKENLDKLMSSDNKCPVCGSKLSESKKNTLIQERQNLINRLRTELKKIESELENAQREKDEIERLTSKLSFLEDKIKSLDTSGIDELKKLCKILDKKYSDLKKAQQTIEEEKESLLEKKETYSKNIVNIKNKIEQALESEKRKKRLQSLKEEMKILEEEITSIKKEFSVELLQNKREEYEELIRRKESIQSKMKSTMVLIEEKQLRIDEILKQKKSIDDARKTSGVMLKVIESLERFIKAVEETQVELRERFVKSVNETMDVIWSDLYPYNDFSAIRISIVNQDYALQLKSNSLFGSRWVDVSSVSGGERSLAALCLRIAFALVLAAQLKWLVLDEPTHNLDQHAVETFAYVLREKVTNFVNQIFVITHEEKLEDAATGSIYRLEKDKITKIKLD